MMEKTAVSWWWRREYKICSTTLGLKGTQKCQQRRTRTFTGRGTPIEILKNWIKHGSKDYIRKSTKDWSWIRSHQTFIWNCKSCRHTNKQNFPLGKRGDLNNLNTNYTVLWENLGKMKFCMFHNNFLLVSLFCSVPIHGVSFFSRLSKRASPTKLNRRYMISTLRPWIEFPYKVTSAFFCKRPERIESRPMNLFQLSSAFPGICTCFSSSCIVFLSPATRNITTYHQSASSIRMEKGNADIEPPWGALQVTYIVDDSLPSPTRSRWPLFSR